MTHQRVFDYPSDDLALRLNTVLVSSLRMAPDGSGNFLVFVNEHATSFATEAEATAFLDLWTARVEDAR